MPEGQYPGSVLVKLGLGTLREFSEASKAWHAEALSLRKLTSYLLRVHVYQVGICRFGFGVGLGLVWFGLVGLCWFGLVWFGLVIFGLV